MRDSIGTTGGTTTRGASEQAAAGKQRVLTPLDESAPAAALLQHARPGRAALD